jgi:hypothetical protein
VSGAITFIVGLVLAYKGKTAGFRVLKAISVLAIIVACYQAWNDEYLKNSGNVTVDVIWTSPENTNASIVSFNMFATNSRNKRVTISAIYIARVNANFDNIAHSLTEPMSMHQFFDICKDVGSPNMINRSHEWKMSDNKSVFAYLTQNELTIDGSPVKSISLDANQSKYVSATFAGQQISREKYNTSTICMAIEFYESDLGFHAVMCSGVESQAIPTTNRIPIIMFGPFKERIVLYPKLDDRCQERLM